MRTELAALIEAFPSPGGEPPRHLRTLLALPVAARDAILDFLVPPEALAHHGMARCEPWGERGRCRLIAFTRHPALRLEVWPDPGGPDPAFVLELAETHMGHLEAAWIVLNDLSGPRYAVDLRPDGTKLALGSAERNVGEELLALEAGLAPNQVRPGIRAFRSLIDRMEALSAVFGAEFLYVAPLAYHNALKYEKYGFLYMSDQEEMEELHARFSPGGDLAAKMDASSPFRMPGMEKTQRGRSWAVHDGILGGLWRAPQMFKIVGNDAHIVTAPGIPW